MIDISILCTHNVYSFIFYMERAVQITTFKPVLLFCGTKGKCSSETCSLQTNNLALLLTLMLVCTYQSIALSALLLPDCIWSL